MRFVLILYWCLCLNFQTAAANQQQLSEPMAIKTRKGNAEENQTKVDNATLRARVRADDEEHELPPAPARGEENEDEDDVEFDDHLQTPPPKNFTEAEINAWLTDSEAQFIQRSNGSTPTVWEEQVEDFLLVLHSAAEASCLLARHNQAQSVSVRGQIVTLHVQFITKRLESQLKAKNANGAASQPSPTRMEVEIGESLSQFCSEVDEGLAFKCRPLCLATMHYKRDLLSSQSTNWGESGEIWDSFLVGAEEMLIIDPETQPPFRKPLVFRISVQYSGGSSGNVNCLRWNYSFWDNKSCLESKRISATVIECRCWQFGYFKIESTRSESNNSDCPLLEFRIENFSSSNRNDKNLTALSNSIKNQLLHQLNLSSSWHISDLRLRVIPENRTVSVRFKLSRNSSGCDHRWQTVVDRLDELLQTQSLNLTGVEGGRLSIPRQKSKIIYDEDEQEMGEVGLVAAAVAAAFFGVILLAVTIAAIRKYRKERQNSVKVLSGSAFARSLTAIGPNSIERPPKTNVRRMSFSSPDQNQNSFRNSNNHFSLNLQALPNTTIQ